MKYLSLILLSLCACAPEMQVKTDTDAIIEAVLADPDVGKFIHPEIPGRLPVLITLSPPVTSELHATAFGRPVRLTKSNGREVLQLEISAVSQGTKVTLAYPIEGMGGELVLQKFGGKWLIRDKSLWEY